MKRTFVSLLTLALLTVGGISCAEKPATRVAPGFDPRVMDFADQAGGPAKPVVPSAAKADQAVASKGQPADAVKLILLQLLVGR